MFTDMTTYSVDCVAGPVAVVPKLSPGCEEAGAGLKLKLNGLDMLLGFSRMS